MKTLTNTLLIFLLITFVTVANASTIGTASFFRASGVSEIVSEWDFDIISFHYDDIYPPISPMAVIYDSLILTEDSIGQIYTATPDNDPGFNLFAAEITDNINNRIGTAGMRGSGGGSYGMSSPEAIFFFGYPPPADRVDFNGYNISSISLQIDNISFESPGEDTNRDGNWTQGRLNATLLIEGELAPNPIPEPSTMLLLGSGLVGLVAFRKKFKK